MSQQQFTLISKGTAKARFNLVAYVGPSGKEAEYCLVFVVSSGGEKIVIEDAKQARCEDVKNYLIDIFKQDPTTTTLSCRMEEAALTRDRLARIFASLGRHTLGLPPRTPLSGMERVKKYLVGHEGDTAWGEILDKVDPNKSVHPELSSDEHTEQASMSELTGQRPEQAAPPAPAAQAPPPPPVENEDESFDSLLGGEEEEQEPESPPLKRHDKVSGVEGKLIFFTARYSKVLDELAGASRAAGGDVTQIGDAIAQAAEQVRKITKEVSAIPPDYFVHKDWSRVHPDLNALFIHRLHFNLPQYKEKSKSGVVRILSMEITPSTKREPESISVEFLYKKRFDLLPEPGDRLRDLLRFSFGKDLALEESFPYITRKVDLTKLYYCFHDPEHHGKMRLTDLFCFRELDGRAGMVYVPYDYLGTGVLNRLLDDFFAHPWKGRGVPAE